MVDSETCPNSNTIPVWLLDMTQKQAGLFCLDAETTGQLIQDGQCKDDKDQLIFATDGRLVCLNESLLGIES